MVELKNIEFYKNPDYNWKEEKINGRNISIPNDWIKNKIVDCGNIITGNTPSTIDNQLWSNEETSFKWISTPNLNNGIIKTSNRFLTNKGKEKGRSAKKDALLISCIGSIGECGILKEESFFNQQINAIEFNDNFNNFYIKYFFNYKKGMFKNYVPQSIVPVLNKEEFKKFNIFNASIIEQEKIASILETQENLIISKKELLEKYKKQRKYFQQELLSGRIRMKLNNKSMAEAFELGLIKQTFLNDANEVIEYGEDTITNVNIDIIDKDGFESWLSIDFENKIEFYKNIDFKEEKINGRKLLFPNEWKIDILKNILKGNTGFTPPTNNETNFIGQTRWINISDMNQKYIENKKYLNDNIPNIKTKKLDKGSLLFSFKLSIGKVGFTKFDNMVTNEAIIGYSPKNNYNLKFYYYAMPKYTILNTGRNAFGMDLMNLELIENSKMILPSNIEMYLIAEQLTKIDNLIESLEEEIKLEDKQFTYLKQELLSGRIRVN